MSYPQANHFKYERGPTRPRVVVTGVGAVSAAGVGAKPLWDALMEGRTCIDVYERAPVGGADIGIAAAVKDWDATRHIDAEFKPRRMARMTQFAVVAALEALKDAGYRPESVKDGRAAVVVGSTMGTTREVEMLAYEIEEVGPRGVAASSIATQNYQAASIAVAELLRAPSVNLTSLMNNCTSGVDAIGHAYEMIRSGRYDFVVCGGAEAPLTAVISSVIKASGLTQKQHSPTDASRPFDRERVCGILGEGAGVVVLESADSAEERGARPYVEIRGVASAPDEQRNRPSSGLAISMKGALNNANSGVEEIDFISAWGCGDALLDRYETEAIKEVFGRDAYRLAVGSIKGAIGIPLAAAGALQMVALSLIHRNRMLPPTVNYRHGDLDCDLDYVGGEPRRVRLRKTMLNAHGLSGSNISLVISDPT